ncbi:MAG TPA: 50S ribosomal protein L10 [Dehalococcoidia bacterium]|nr:50S ribosomal protein L10 [Dehalococcoidia bacterium]
MPTERKEHIIRELEDLLSRSKVLIATDYRGLSVADITRLRRRLREAGIDYHVVKNTLTARAAEKVDRKALEQLLKGPTALAFGFGDEVEPAKVLTDYIRTSRLNLPIRGALVDSRVLNAAEVTSLATMPPKEVLIARVVGGIQAPIARLMGVLVGPQRSLVGVLEARRQQLEGQGA